MTYFRAVQPCLLGASGSLIPGNPQKFQEFFGRVGADNANGFAFATFIKLNCD